jgi:hypothetical protein
LRFGLDQPDIDENLDIGGNRRLRQIQFIRHLVDILGPRPVQQV